MNQYRLPLIGFLLACTLSIILLPGATAEELVAFTRAVTSKEERHD